LLKRFKDVERSKELALEEAELNAVLAAKSLDSARMTGNSLEPELILEAAKLDISLAASTFDTAEAMSKVVKAALDALTTSRSLPSVEGDEKFARALLDQDKVEDEENTACAKELVKEDLKHARTSTEGDEGWALALEASYRAQADELQAQSEKDRPFTGGDLELARMLEGLN